MTTTTTLTSDLQYLLSLDSAHWQLMLDLHTIHLVLVTSVKSLTLTRNLIATIRDTLNKKYRRKYIIEFSQLLAGVVISRRNEDALNLLVRIHKTYNNQASNNDAAYIRSNETGHSVASAYQVGDSKHFTSCLRSGIQRSEFKLTDEDPNSKDVYENEYIQKTKGGEYDDFVPKHEVDAFMSGEIQYCVVGKLYTEGGDGYSGRYRIHRGKLDGSDRVVYQLSNYYGIDAYREPILAKILEYYGAGNVYVNTPEIYVTDSTPMDICVDNDDVYCDEVSGCDNFMLLTPNKPIAKSAYMPGRSVKWCVRLVDSHYGMVLQDTDKSKNPPIEDSARPDTVREYAKPNEVPDVLKEDDWVLVSIQCRDNVNAYVELINQITGSSYYAYTIANEFRTLIYARRKEVERLRATPNHQRVNFDHPTQFCVQSYVVCVLKWSTGLSVYNYGYSRTMIRGHKNIRRIVKLGLLNVMNTRWKVTNEALPNMPTMSTT